MRNSKVRKFLPVFIFISAMSLLCFTAGAEDFNSESDPLVSLSYVNNVLKPQIIEEILSQISTGTEPQGSVFKSTPYHDISIDSGKMLLISADCEFIYRGGGAVIITASVYQNDGIYDMSAGTEYFSGKQLEYGHVYYAAESDTSKYILITGQKATFTIRGSYEIK